MILALPARSATITVVGPDGAGPSGAGGNALAVSDGPDASNMADATGGNGVKVGPDVGPGGSAQATGAANGTGSRQATAFATGGDGAFNSTGPAGAGGGATASADARSSDGGPAIAEAHATNGVSGVVGPAPVATAHAESVLGGSASASVFAVAAPGQQALTGAAADGGSVALHDAATGVTPGNLSLRQSASAGAGGDGYDGAAPGSGGSASSSLTLDAHSSQLDVRLASRGGAGGALGDVVLQGPGGTGGDASSEADLSNPDGGISLRSLAIAGNAGSSASGASSGGSATVDARAHTVGDGHAISIGQGAPGSDFGAFGGVATGSLTAPGISGGAAQSTSIGLADGDSTVFVRDNAVGGDGQNSQTNHGGGGGGSATSHAEGSNTGASSITVISGASAGRGAGVVGSDHAANGGVATASANGVSTGGGVVTVSVEQVGGNGGQSVNSGSGGDGADSILQNAATGSTSGALTLRQRAVAGNGGPTTAFSGGGGGGDARSDLVTVHDGAGALTLESTAIAGRSGARGPGDGSAEASTRGTGGGDVNISVNAVVGDPSFDAFDQSGPGGTASIDVAEGISTGGGTVTVTASATGGKAGDGAFPEQSNGGSVSLINAARAQTTGAVSLTQLATGGHGGAGGGIGGTATSILDQPGFSGPVTATVKAKGGSDNRNFPPLGCCAVGNFGGDADAENTISSGGPVTLSTQALGGTGYDGHQGGDGGSARVRANAATTAPGAGIAIGALDRSFTGAVGGQGGRGFTNGLFGSGGSAESASTGVASGGGAVLVVDRASGGASQGHAGDASSFASGVTSGASAVQVVSEANGGRSLYSGEFVGFGGAATSSASGRGLGSVDVTAKATAGASDYFAAPSIAQASAEGVGASGLAAATAFVGDPDFGYLRASASGPSAASTHAFSFAGSNTAAQAIPTGVTGALGIDRPFFADAAAARGRAGAAAEAMFDPLLLASLSAARSEGSAGAVTEAASLAYQFDLPPSIGYTTDLVIAVFDPEISSSSFEQLTFSVEFNHADTFEVTFTDPEQARAFFSGRVLRLPFLQDLVFLGDLETLDFSLSMVSNAPGTQFSTELFVGVPEPEVLALLLVATLLAILCVSRSSAA